MADETSSRVEKNSSINITKLLLTNAKVGSSISLINIFTHFHIFANIDAPALTGEISIQEKRNNLISLLPIAGYEYLQIEFEIVKSTQDKNKKYLPNKYAGTFFITSVENLVATSESRSFTMKFVSALGIVNPDIRICRAYPSNSDKKSYKCEAILKDIKQIIENASSKNDIYKKIYDKGTFQESRKSTDLIVFSKDHFIDTIFDYKLVVPSWKPIALINYIVSYAVSSKCNTIMTEDNQFSDCVFYENMSQVHEFNCYYEMYNTPLKDKNKKEIELVQRVANNDTSGEELYNIISFEMPKIFNIQEQKMKGLTGETFFLSNFLNYDISPVKLTAQNIQGLIQTYIEEFSDEMVYCPYDAFKLTPNPIYIQDVCGINAEQDENYERDFIMPKMRAMPVVQYLRAATINIKTNPTTDLDIGKYVKLKIAEPAQYNTDANNNKIKSFIENTRWVVGALAYHVYSNMTMEVDLSCFTPYLNRYYDGKTFGI